MWFVGMFGGGGGGRLSDGGGGRPIGGGGGGGSSNPAGSGGGRGKPPDGRGGGGGSPDNPVFPCKFKEFSPPPLPNCCSSNFLALLKFSLSPAISSLFTSTGASFFFPNRFSSIALFCLNPSASCCTCTSDFGGALG